MKLSWLQHHAKLWKSVALDVIQKTKRLQRHDNDVFYVFLSRKLSTVERNGVKI